MGRRASCLECTSLFQRLDVTESNLDDCWQHPNTNQSYDFILPAVSNCSNLFGFYISVDPADGTNYAYSANFLINCTTLSPTSTPTSFFPTYLPTVPINIQLCGNGILDVPEQCDDGNRVSGDGCSPECSIEYGWICSN